jgi:hypothetical protein
MRHSTSRHRAGWTLMEMMVVIPLMVLLLSTAAMLLSALFRSQQSLGDDLQRHSTLARLGTQLRADAHASASAKCDSPQSCALACSSSETIHYEITQTAIRRELRREDAVSEREEYPLPRSAAVFSLDESRELPLVRLTIPGEVARGKYAHPTRASLVEAAVGTLRPATSGRAAP